MSTVGSIAPGERLSLGLAAAGIDDCDGDCRFDHDEAQFQISVP